MILKTFENPTNLFISGIDFIKQSETFSITDDYCTLATTLNGLSYTHLETCGFVFILTEEELLKIIPTIDLNDDSDECLFIKNFVGTIDLFMKSSTGVIWLPDPIDFKEYLQYQNSPEVDWYDVFLNLEGHYDDVSIFLGAEAVINQTKEKIPN